MDIINYCINYLTLVFVFDVCKNNLIKFCFVGKNKDDILSRLLIMHTRQITNYNSGN